MIGCDKLTENTDQITMIVVMWESAFGPYNIF